MINRLSPFLAVMLAVGYAFLYGPIASLVLYSFNASRLVTVWAGFSIHWYVELMHNEAIRSEIAERLKTFLDREPPQRSANLDRLLRRLRELDPEAAPSIVPEVPPMAEVTEPPKPATSHDWLQRLRMFTKRS